MKSRSRPADWQRGLAARGRNAQNEVVSTEVPAVHQSVGAMRKFAAFILSLAIVACSSESKSGEDGSSTGNYAPCSGEPGACRLSSFQGGNGGPGLCLCLYYCEVDADCPTPATGSAVPTCTPFGDVVENGHTASCTLPCDSNVDCPDGMACQTGECWATAN